MTLSGKADRIDRVGAKGLAIVDYKTGTPPSTKMVEEGFARQLGLLALIAEKGGYAKAEGVAELFEYWSLARDTKTQGFGYRKSPTTGKNGLDPETFVADTLTKFAETVGAWLTGSEPFTAKLKPDYAYHDYDHLMRLEEWQGRDA